MARASTTQTHEPTACTKRAAIKSSIVGATMQITVATPKITRAASITGLRPKRSASGP